MGYRVQINDRYEFPETLDLDNGDRKYLSQSSDPSKCNLYKLHSVLVHSGGTHGGHYFAFSRPDGCQWLRFDDEKVRPFPHRANPSPPSPHPSSCNRLGHLLAMTSRY